MDEGATQRIVAAIDLPIGPTGRSRHAVARAALLAVELGARLEIVHVLPPPDALGGLLGGALESARVLSGRVAPALLDHAAARARLRRQLEALDVTALPALLRRGDARREVLAAVAQRASDLLVMGRGGGLIADVLLGSVSRYALRRARIDLMVVPRGGGVDA